VILVWHVKDNMKRRLLKELLLKFIERRRAKKAGVYIIMNGKKVYIKDIYEAEGYINIETEEKINGG